MALSAWHTTAAANATVGTINWAEGQSPATVNDSARATMADVRSFYEAIEWRDWGHTPVYSTASAFTITDAASLSSIYHVNRRIQTIDGGGTAYGTILTTTWVTNTQTVSISFDSGSLTNPMTSVAVGPSVTNQAIHVSGVKSAMTAGTGLLASLMTQTGDLIYSSSTATGAALHVSSTAGTGVLITGATPSWTASPTLAAAVIGNASAGVVAGAVNSQNGYYVQGNKVSPGLNWLETQNPAATATVTFTTALLPNKRYRLVGRVTVSSTDVIVCRFNGDSGANYAVVQNVIDQAGTNNPAASTGSNQITLSNGSTAGDLINLAIEFETEQGDNTRVMVETSTTRINSARTAFNRFVGGGFYDGASALSSITLLTYIGGGTMTGTFRLDIYNES